MRKPIDVGQSERVGGLVQDDAPPDLSSEQHLAIGLHFKKFPSRDDRVWHEEERRWYPIKEFRTSVAIYDDRVRGWFLECARRLPHDAIIVLMIVVAYFEGNEQYRQGETSENKSKKFFQQAFNRIFPELGATDAAEIVYREARCGLFHDGMTRSAIRISNQLPSAIGQTGGRLLISPNKLLEVVVADHGQYIRDLLDANNEPLRRNFEKLWEARWSKSG